MGARRAFFAPVVFILGIWGGVSLGQQSHPFVGSWILNLEKSKFEGLPPLRSETWVVTAEKDGLLRSVIDWVEADGTPGHVEYLSACDGKVYPIQGSSDFDAVKYDQLGPREFRSVLLKQRQVVEREHYVASKDGNTWWDTDRGNDKQGKPWTFHLVLERRH